jgi:signal transduction histidine kinase
MTKGKKERFWRRSVYAKFALIFLAIWWSLNGATMVMIMQLMRGADMEEIRSLTGLIFVNNAIFGTAAILLALRGIVKPITQLSSAAREVASGNLDVSVEVKSKDEIGRLGSDFNTMVREIEGTDRMRREFVSSVSHEFRTPMTSIRGFAKYIGENADDPAAVREYSDIVIAESERLIDMSSALLRLSELDAKTIPVLSEFSLAEQIRQVILMLEPQWGTRDISFDLDLAETTITCDEELLRQVWLNLIQNAIKFSSDGSEIAVRLTVPAPPAVESPVRVTVADSGVGIEPTDLPFIFDHFYKGKTPSHTGGNGLGLAIVNKIIQFVGGTIAVTSQVGVGTTITVDLPR